MRDKPQPVPYQIHPASKRRVNQMLKEPVSEHTCKPTYELVEIHEGEAGDDGYIKVCEVCRREYEV